MTRRRPPRLTKNHLQAVVSEEERAEILRRATVAGLSVSAYLRAAALGAPIRAVVVNHEQILTLAKVNADQSRLGGLLKLWLVEPGHGVPVHEVRQLLDRLAEVQGKLAEVASRL